MMMGSSRGTAFTLAQMEELERQKLIFKYMVASIPVPPQLILPLKSTTTVSTARISGSSSSSSDPEPWRCKRTDGKKWRCSRDVAPHQKYCERHSHKNRPRSRKPVEFLSSNTTANKALMQSRDSNFAGSSVISEESLTHLLPYQPPREFSHAADSAIPRSLEWFMKGEVIALPNPGQVEWQQQLHGQHQQHQQYAPLSPFGHDHELQVRGGHIVNDQCSLLLGMASSEGHNWPEDSASLSRKLPTPSLSLANFGRGVMEEGVYEERASIGQIMGLGVGPTTADSVHECDGRAAESMPHWMNPGGPLAEALCLGSTSTQESPLSDPT
ncbi:hypothetical protein SAY86_027528 [Trapa natans]|uniref:Growth-regulating factor n=1 Tax=Trapa natans TaxID=22666 RepID=A0AAN7KHN3_TRANT|nr:hypothetical protein SAY86_027528 [Trapa natans]